ncbi:26S proteasome non-ATPase regulatory subunit 4 [Tanacetum coccineum]
MVGEVTAVFMDTSEWMGHNRSDRFLDQVDAIEVYCQKKLKSHPDNHVTIFATGLTGFGCLVEPTQHLSKIMDGVLVALFPLERRVKVVVAQPSRQLTIAILVPIETKLTTSPVSKLACLSSRALLFLASRDDEELGVLDYSSCLH